MKQGRKTRNLAETRRKILAAAFEEIFARGFHASSIDAILEKTDLTKGALFHQFATKLELGYAVVDEVIAPMTLSRWVDPLEAFEDPRAGILHQLERNVGDAPQAALNLGCPLNNLIQEMANTDPGFQRRLRRVLDRWIDGLAAHLERGRRAGVIRKSVKARDVAEYIVVAHEGFFGIIKGLRDKRIYRSLRASLELYLVGISEVPMSGYGRPSINKRNREQARRDRARAKEERRAERATERKDRTDAPDGEDPDIAGIKPGPQPPLED